tara:strand:- start:1320 stop:2018 length:699 start_codon:yes stop_codon:yes gene_type:complete
MECNKLNGIITYAPTSRMELISYAMKQKKILIAVNAEKILNANLENKKIINRNIGYPDGIGAVWALKKKGFVNTTKIPGCELWLEIISNYYQSKSFYLIGAKQEVINETVKKLKFEFEGINICNFRNGYFESDNDIDALANDIKFHKPDIVFVAMGSPKQEIIMEYLHKKYKSVYQGLGGSFNVYAGIVKRAPDLMIKLNLEWAYRLFMQPSRIKRQIVYIPFIIKLLFNKI